MEKKDVFVKTTDLETADTLKKDGFVQVDYSAGADIIVKLTSLIKNDNKECKEYKKYTF